MKRVEWYRARNRNLRKRLKFVRGRWLALQTVAAKIHDLRDTVYPSQELYELLNELESAAEIFEKRSTRKP